MYLINIGNINTVKSLLKIRQLVYLSNNCIEMDT